MVLAGTYTVYGNIYDEDGNASVGATVRIVDCDNNQGSETFTTIAAGYYQINIDNIASDGDVILVEVTLPSGHIYGECFTLDLYESPKNINIIVEEYDYLELTSDSYTCKLRFCPIEALDKDISKTIDVLNFWKTNDISTVDRGLSSEPFNFSGIEYAKTEKEVCYIAKKFERIWGMQDNDEEVIVNHAEFGDCYNDVYVIKSFSFRTIRKCPNAYLWTISLERVRDI